MQQHIRCNACASGTYKDWKQCRISEDVGRLQTFFYVIIRNCIQCETTIP